MNKVVILTEELKEHFQEQTNFIRKSAHAFDGGDISEGKRLALHLRTLLYDTKNSKSVLGQLEVKNDIHFLNSSSDYNPKNLMPHIGLVRLVATSIIPANFTCQYAPLLNEFRHRYKWCLFDEWWAKQIVIKDQQSNQFTREELILFVANQGGGAHVDPKISQKYHAIKNNSVGWNYSNGTTQKSFEDVELVSIRQIAFEFLESMINASVIGALK